MKTIPLSLVLILFVVGCGAQPQVNSTLAASVEPSYNCSADETFTDEYDCNQTTRVVGHQILATLWNAPASGQYLADIKNVDLVAENLQQYIGSGNRYRYRVFVRSWVDLGEKTLAVKIIDKDRPAAPLTEKARKIGQDSNGQYIYLMSVALRWGESQKVYLTTTYRGRTHYSNEGRPLEFFELHSRDLSR